MGSAGEDGTGEASLTTKIQLLSFQLLLKGFEIKSGTLLELYVYNVGRLYFLILWLVWRTLVNSNNNCIVVYLPLVRLL